MSNLQIKLQPHCKPSHPADLLVRLHVLGGSPATGPPFPVALFLMLVLINKISR